jgi:SulP family sulfate permease
MGPLAVQKLSTALPAALIVGVINITYTISFSALVFNGVLAGYFQLGMSIVLVSYAIASFVMASGSSLPGLIVTPKGALVAIVSVMAASIISASSTMVDGETALATLLMCLMISTFAAGLCFFFLGVFRLGNLIRFIPFPIMAGYFGGVGILLVKGSFTIMTDISFTFNNLHELIADGNMILWIPGVVFALVGLIVARRFAHFLAIPLVIATGIILFYIAAGMLRLYPENLRSLGLLMPLISSKIMLPQFVFFSIEAVRWEAVWGQWGSILSILLVGNMSILLYISITEVGTGQEIQLEMDLKAAGVANMVSALIGGVVSFHEPVDTKLSYRLGGKTRIVGYLFGLVCLVFVFCGGYVVGYFPKPIMGGLILCVGLELLLDNVGKSWRQLPKSEFALVCLIIVVVALLGFLKGIGVGILLAILLFVINYSRTEVIKSHLSGRIYHSKVERSPMEQRVLSRCGDGLQIFILQGYLFFGTAERLLSNIRQLISKHYHGAENRPAFIIIDFRLVQNIDSSALNAFAKLLKTAENKDIKLVFTDMNALAGYQFDTMDYFDNHHAIRFDHLDYGLEWCEEQLLRSESLPDEQLLDFDAHLTEILQHPDMVPHFKSFLDEITLSEGDTLFRKGDASDSLYFIKSGRVSILLPKPDGTTVRLRTMGAGTLVGEIGLYTEKPRSAHAVADRASTLNVLTYERFKALERQFPDISRQFHKFVVRSLSFHMAQDSEAMQVLLA